MFIQEQVFEVAVDLAVPLPPAASRTPVLRVLGLACVRGKQEPADEYK